MRFYVDLTTSFEHKTDKDIELYFEDYENDSILQYLEFDQCIRIDIKNTNTYIRIRSKYDTVLGGYYSWFQLCKETSCIDIYRASRVFVKTINKQLCVENTCITVEQLQTPYTVKIYVVQITDYPVAIPYYFVLLEHEPVETILAPFNNMFNIMVSMMSIQFIFLIIKMFKKMFKREQQ